MDKSSHDRKEEAVTQILARSSVKRRIVEQLAEGGKTPSELSASLATKLPNITSALRDLTDHFIVYQANPGSTKGKLYVLTEAGYNALAALENRTTEGLVRHYSSQPSNHKGRVIRSSKSEMKCIFDFDIRQWDFVSGHLEYDMGTYSIIGVVNEVQISPSVQVGGRPETHEQMRSCYLANVLILGTLTDQHIASQTPLLPIGHPMDIASEEDVKQVLSLQEENKTKTISFGMTRGRPHFPVALGSVHPIYNILIGDIPRRTQIAAATKIIKDIITKTDMFTNQGIVFCFTEKPKEFMHLKNRLITKKEEFHSAQLSSLFREYEESGEQSGKFMIVDFSAEGQTVAYHVAANLMTEMMALSQLITYLEDLHTREQKKLPKGSFWIGPPVSIVIDEADRFLFGENIEIFENVLEKGRGYFDHRILIAQSPLISSKILRTTPTLLLGSNSIRRVDILDQKPWEYHFDHKPFMEMMQIPTRLAESDYMFLNTDLNFPILLTTTEKYDTAKQNMEQVYIERTNQLFDIAKKAIGNVNKNITTEGSTMTHNFDISFTKDRKIYLIQYKRLDQKGSIDRIRLAREWVFPTIDINTEYNRFILVYEGDLDPAAAKILQHYYDAVVPFHKFKEYLREESRNH